MHQYKTHLITSADDRYFNEAQQIYRQSFPLHEQRTEENMIETLSHPDFRYAVSLNEQDRIVGLRIIWHTPSFDYLEYFAISPEFRSGGIGKYLLDELTTDNPGKVILEIDPVGDEITTRRLNFYLRNGFVANEKYDYIHPPYKEGDAPYPLLVMSHLEPLSQERYDEFEAYHHSVVVNV